MNYLSRVLLANTRRKLMLCKLTFLLLIFTGLNFCDFLDRKKNREIKDPGKLLLFLTPFYIIIIIFFVLVLHVNVDQHLEHFREICIL